MTASPELVRFERLGGHIGLVTLNRPAVRNAINAALSQALDSLVAQIEADAEIWSVVLTGAGEDAFCAGADLKEVSQGGLDALFTSRGGFAGFVRAPREKPWIAAVNGKAFAGGCEIALACDAVVAAEHASFALPEVKRGLIAAAGGAFRLPRAMPRHIAFELLMTGEPLEAVRAERYGLVNRIAQAGQVIGEAVELARRINRNAPVAVRESLSIARRSLDLSEEQGWALSAVALDRVSATDDFAEGPLAFLEKRSPRWLGR